MTSSAVDNTGSRRRQNVQPTAAMVAAGYERLHRPGHAERKANEPRSIDCRGYLQEEQAVAVLLQDTAVAAAPSQVAGPDVRAIEPCRGSRDESDGRQRGGDDGAPAPGQRQHQRQQQAELRLDGEDAEQHAREHGRRSRLARPQDQQRRQEEPVLPDEHVDGDGRSHRDEEQMLALDAACPGGKQEESQSPAASTARRPASRAASPNGQMNSRMCGG